jgi:glutaredoxin
MASQGTSIFGDTLKGKLGNLKRTRLTLLVTPTCPYCAQAVLIENSLVMDSEKNLSIDIVETYENPDIARQYNVTGVPVTVFNGNPLDTIVGVPTLGSLLQKLRK